LTRSDNPSDFFRGAGIKKKIRNRIACLFAGLGKAPGSGLGRLIRAATLMQDAIQLAEKMAAKNGLTGQDKVVSFRINARIDCDFFAVAAPLAAPDSRDKLK